MAVLAVTVAATLASPAAAQNHPRCDPASEPVLGFGWSPSPPRSGHVIAGREYYIDMVDRDADDYTALITLSRNGTQFLSKTINSNRGLVTLRASRSGDLIDITASYTESKFTATDEWGDPVESSRITCQRSLATTVRGTRGRPMPAPRVIARRDKAVVRLAYPARCEAQYEAAPLVVKIKAPGSGWKALRASDQCEGWDKFRMRGSGFRTYGNSDESRSLVFLPMTPRATGATSYRFKISKRGRTLRRGTIRVRTTHRPAKRIYAWHPGGTINDAYWNYCVNGGRTAWMENGNAYCVIPSDTTRRVSVR
jgi:hypothetical protein